MGYKNYLQKYLAKQLFYTQILKPQLIKVHSLSKIQYSIRIEIKNIQTKISRYLQKIQIQNQLIRMIHGTKKQKKVKTIQQIKQQEQISNKINAKLGDFFLIRNAPYSDEQVDKYLQFTALLMQLCSDIPTIFNFRRQLLARSIKMNYQDVQKVTQILVHQIKLVTKLIRQDPKSYTLWSYRQWLVQKIYSKNKSIVKEQKQLCKLLLTKDQKNFHVWNYRNWVNSVQMNVDEQLQFTSQKIKSNPFNFSPFHFRSKYLPLKYESFINNSNKQLKLRNEIIQYGMPKQTFDAQLQTIKTAIFLNPNQQAPWIYYRWLLKRLLPVILLSSQLKQGKHIVILNQRVKDFKRYVRYQSSDKSVTSSQQSCIWSFESIELLQISKQNTIQSQGIIKWLITDRKTDLSQIHTLYDAEKQFIKQILQQQQNCRFALLQLLQIMKNILHLTCQWNKWSQIVQQGNKAFQKLNIQIKNKEYIKKLFEYWQRIRNFENLAYQQKLLVNNL